MHSMISAFLPGSACAGARAFIINIASVVSTEMVMRSARRDQPPTATTKAAVVGLTKSVARDYISMAKAYAVTPSVQERSNLRPS